MNDKWKKRLKWVEKCWEHGWGCWIVWYVWRIYHFSSGGRQCSSPPQSSGVQISSETFQLDAFWVVDPSEHRSGDSGASGASGTGTSVCIFAGRFIRHNSPVRSACMCTARNDLSVVCLFTGCLWWTSQKYLSDAQMVATHCTTPQTMKEYVWVMKYAYLYLYCFISTERNLLSVCRTLKRPWKQWTLNVPLLRKPNTDFRMKLKTSWWIWSAQMQLLQPWTRNKGILIR